MMTDKDKIIKAIKCRTERNNRCGNPCEETGNCHYAKCMVGLDGEPYYPFVCDTEQLCTDVLALLKEQEPKIGHWIESKCLDECFWVCSECNFPSEAIAAPKLYKYCPNCGTKMEEQAVKWE